jgi:hypothetical protein
MRYKCILSVVLAILILAGCRAPTPGTVTAVPTATRWVVETFTPGATSTAISEASATPTPVQPTATVSPTALTIRVEPTFTPRPRDDRISLDDLPVGEPGHYVNVTFGYWLQYPHNWYTGFGNRPLLVSISNLDPGTNNRDSMRAQGCLIEVNASTNVYGIPLEELLAQIPRTFPDAEDFELDGEPAVRVLPSSPEDRVQSETILVEHDDWLIVLASDYARDAAETCRPAWQNLLATWRWFRPAFATYRNTNYGYAISYPRDWYRFNAHERGIFISSEDPADTRDVVDLATEGMVLQSDVLENPDNLPLKDWLAAQELGMYLTNDIALGWIVGVRVLREGPSPEIQELRGYFEGPLGDIHVITCGYPADREWEFRPIANAIIYSFSF